jgi:beta-phosphoglucomutase-like phosphatase (HAD superfamily)
MTDLQLSEPLNGLEAKAGAFLFDCDGTLVDTMGAHYESWMDVLRSVEPEVELEFDLFCTWGGMAGDLVAREICLELKLPHEPLELAQRKRDHFLGQDHRHPVIAPVADFARRVAATHPVAVVSGGNRQAVDQTLRAADLHETLPVVVTPEDVVHGKPAPDMFLLAAEKLGVDPGVCWVLEDGPPGIIGAQAAGMNVVAIGAAANQQLK